MTNEFDEHDLLFGEFMQTTKDRNIKHRNVANSLLIATPPKHDMLFTSVPHEDTFQLPEGLAFLKKGHLGIVESKVNLIPICVIPEKYQIIFNSFPYFNVVQSTIFDDVFYTDKSLAVCAPTGSGKTVIFELAIVRLLMKLSDTGHDASNYKIIYMAPIKALCSERYEDWTKKFAPLGVLSIQLTGDSEAEDYFELQKYSIILTTPEKWDCMTRRWRDNKTLVQMVQLFLIDEIHLLNEEERGATMEVALSRMKTSHAVLCREILKRSEDLRFVAVSATFPNAEDVTEWLSSKTLKGSTYKLDESLRPVNLRKVVIGYSCHETWTEFKFDLSLSYRLSNVIYTYSEKKPSLVFCSTRKSVVQTATILSKEAKFVFNSEHKQMLIKVANMLRDNKLRETVLSGIGFHHAGLDYYDRKQIEDLFAKGDLPVLVSTSTLAMGVNFPAHLVVIKSTVQYISGCYKQYSDTQILQMIGRAGRPQFDSSATAVIMTKQNLKEQYKSLVNGTQMIESSLHKHLAEHLNAEVVLGTIKDVSVAMEWIRSTFLYIRILKNPKHYGIFTGLSIECIEKKLQDMCVKELNALAKNKLVKMDDNCFDLNPTGSGRLMARYYVAFETMKHFSSLKGTESLSELLTLISGCKEFEDICLRVNEKKVLNCLNNNKHKATIRFPMRGKIKTQAMKVNCLIQAGFGCLQLQEASLNQDISKIMRSGQRVSKCLADYLSLEMKGFHALLNSVILAKCFKARLWENSKYVSRQLEKIGVTLSNVLVNAGIASFLHIKNTNPRELEMILNRHPPFGTHLHDAVFHLPNYEISINQDSCCTSSKAILSVTVNMTNYTILQVKHTAPANHSCLLIIGDSDNKIILKQRVMDSQLIKSGQWTKRIQILRAEKGDEITVHFISEYLVGLDAQSTCKPFYNDLNKISSKINEDRKFTSNHQNKNKSLKSSVDCAPTMSSILSLENCKRNCNHRCTNKKICAHECCKVGVTILLKETRKTNMSSFLNQLHDRVNSMPPKKPKMASGAFDHGLDLNDLAKAFSYVPKAKWIPDYFLPTVSVKTNMKVSTLPNSLYNDEFQNAESLVFASCKLEDKAISPENETEEQLEYEMVSSQLPNFDLNFLDNDRQFENKLMIPSDQTKTIYKGVEKVDFLNIPNYINSCNKEGKVVAWKSKNNLYLNLDTEKMPFSQAKDTTTEAEDVYKNLFEGIL